MANQNFTEIKKKVIEKMTSQGLSANKAAAIIGISPATLNIVLNETYLVKPELSLGEKMWIKLANWSGCNTGWQTAGITNYKKVWNICEHSQDESISRAISFAPGSGKTYALKAYASTNKNCYYIECDEYWTKKIFLKKLAAEMGLDVMASNIGDMVDSIILHLNLNQNCLVIIDEADKLRDAVLNLYKTLYNKTNSGFVLCGTPYFQIRINKGVEKNRMGFKEIFSRIGGEFYKLHEIDTQSIRMICKVNGIDDERDILEVIDDTHQDLRRTKSKIDQIKLRVKKQLTIDN